MKRFHRGDLCLMVCGALLWLLWDTQRVRQSVTAALSLCARSVIPALFPFLTVSSLLISLGFALWLSPWFSGLMALFHLPGAAGAALLLGLVGGYPIGVRTAVELYRSGRLSQQEANHLLTFCNNASPAFFLSVLGIGVFGNLQAGLWLWLIHLFSALLTGLLFRPAASFHHRDVPPLPAAPPSFAAALVSSVRDAGTTMLGICAFVVFFYVLCTPLRALPAPLSTLLIGFTESFSLLPLLRPDGLSFVLAAGLTGWGGLSVLFQSAAVLEGSDLQLRFLCRGKALQAILSAALAWPMWHFLL